MSGFPRKSESRILRCGLLGLVFSLCLHSCVAAARAEPDFYQGLKNKSEGLPKAAANFIKALDSKNPRIASAASAELMVFHIAGMEISSAVMKKIRQKVSGTWAEVFEVLAALQAAMPDNVPAVREKILALLLGGGRDRIRDEAALYVLEQCNIAGNATEIVLLSDAENAAIEGRFAVSRSRYNEALVFFRIVLRDSPELFFRYPDLLADLGRTFQYTATGKEGINLFLEWEKIVAGEETEGLPEAVIPGNENIIRYLLLFYSARIARQRGDGDTSVELFAQAFPFAQEASAEQTDACIWYILDSSLAVGPGAAVSQLEKYISQWQDDSYFFDVMDKLTRELILQRRWNNILSVFELVRDHSGTMTAKYAWIIGRAIEEGLLSPEDIRRAEKITPPVSAEETAAEAYKRVALNEGAGIGNIGLYYRFLASTALGEPFPALQKMPPEKPKSTRGGESAAIRFLLGFFEHNAGEFAPRYIRAEENDLSADDLRRLAEVLGAAGQYRESMRLVSLYTKQDGYLIGRGDLELSHPRPYKELVEQYAQETGIDPALLFGLIRTESAFDKDAVSRAGASGLTQLMPATADEAAVRIRRQGGPDYITVEENGGENVKIDLCDPAVNIHIGASYLAFLNERMGDPLLALLAYNGGMGNVRRWIRAATRSAGTALPPDLFLETADYTETRDYGRSVTAAAAVYRELYYADIQ